MAIDLLPAELFQPFGDHRHGDAQGLADLLGLQRTLACSEADSSFFQSCFLAENHPREVELVSEPLGKGHRADALGTRHVIDASQVFGDCPLDDVDEIARQNRGRVADMILIDLAVSLDLAEQGFDESFAVGDQP